MDMFSSYRLVKVEGGYDLELYIHNPGMNDAEFAEEFGRIDPDNRQRLNRNILDFIAEKFPETRIRMVKVLVGSLVLASFFYTAPIKAQAAAGTGTQAQAAQDAQREANYDYSARISINGQLQSFDSKPFFYNYTTYVNLYEFGQKIGASVWWNNSSNTVGINKNGVQIAFMRGSSIARVNGRQVSMPRSLVVNGVTYAPLKFIAENLGYEVTLDSATNTVMVNKKADQAVNTGVYTVVAGDTLWSIAKRYNTTVDSLKELNNLTSDMIYPGQKLNLHRTHMVKSGDSLWRLAQQYGISVDDIKKANNIKSDMILVGQTLIIPGAGAQVPAPSPGKPSPVTSWPDVTYIVQPGDTASSIAKKFGVSQQDIMRYNYKDPDEWFNAGEKIAISGYAPRTYTVTPGQDKAPARKGALVEWYNEGKHLIKRNNTFTVVDVETGRQFKAVMIGGYNHADIEPATRADTEIMKELFGEWRWSPRAVVVYINGMNIAASLSGMPHGADTVTDNGVNGMFDLYLKGSTSHSSSTSKVYIQEHANMVLKAAGF
ncbi:MAG: LysM peptidoglycan-binding domain-containing protein [Clostridiaceae bacterium]|jgi:LysM repeat protein|nr:LysM peptidoglycan-binding domain-containing protein [Clostridiaceae bacterium]